MYQYGDWLKAVGSQTKLAQTRELGRHNASDGNEDPKLELPRAWEPLDRLKPSQTSEETSSMVCFLMETRLDKEGFHKVYNDLPFQNRIIVKQPNSGGGLALLWKS